MTSRLDAAVRKLRRRYGVLESPPAKPFELFVWEILSGHSMPSKRDAAFGALKRHRLLTPDAMWTASAKTLESSVALAGPFCGHRLLALRKGVEVFRRTPALGSALEGSVPAALRQLKPLPRMTGEGSAYRMLLFAGTQAVFPVDARVARVATRLGYGETLGNFSKTARSVRQALAAELPGSIAQYRRAYLYLEHHGAVTCTESDPRCDTCSLRTDCPHYLRERR
jgi:endonuclease III